MKPISIFILVFALIACGKKDANLYDTNPAEANETPGDVGRGNSETNAEAEARAARSGAGIVSPAKTSANSNDRFPVEAAEGGFTEVYLSKLASTKTKDKKLLAFAEMMMKDHGKANEELRQIASAKGITLPADCSTCKETYRQLHDLVGKDFEKQYIAIMVTDHEKAISKFAKESEDGKDPDFRSFAKSKLPTLRHHLAEAKDLEGSVQ